MDATDLQLFRNLEQRQDRIQRELADLSKELDDVPLLRQEVNGLHESYIAARTAAYIVLAGIVVAVVTLLVSGTPKP